MKSSLIRYLLMRNYCITHTKYSFQKLICQLGLTQDDYVLNLGSGTGGAAFLLAKHYSVNVHAVDLSANMTCTAMDRFAQPDIHPRNKVCKLQPYSV